MSRTIRAAKRIEAIAAAARAAGSHGQYSHVKMDCRDLDGASILLSDLQWALAHDPGDLDGLARYAGAALDEAFQAVVKLQRARRVEVAA